MIYKDNNHQKLLANIDFYDKSLKAKNKGIKIIKSCKSNIHLDVAKKYIDLYLMRFGDNFGHSELEFSLINKRKKIA